MAAVYMFRGQFVKEIFPAEIEKVYAALGITPKRRIMSISVSMRRQRGYGHTG
jgi:hypothetical protein